MTKLLTCEATKKEMMTVMKPEKKTLMKLFESGKYKGYDKVKEILGGK